MNSSIRIVFCLLFFINIIFSQEKEFNKTLVTPHLYSEIEPGVNVVYASSFHSAWIRLKEDILKENVKVEKDLEIVDYLNKAEELKLNSENFVSIAGFVESGIIEKINGATLDKFNRSVDLSDYADKDENIICFSAFSKSIKFKTEFETFEQTFPFFSNGKQIEVECFGIWNAGNSEIHKKIIGQVKIFDYKNDRDFILCLGNPGENEEIIIAKIQPESTLIATIENVDGRINNSVSEKLCDGNRLVIPKVVLNIHKNYYNLLGKHLANKGFEKYFFTAAIHDIAFELNESGASASSEAKIVLKKGPGPRTLLVNRPFLLMMKEKDSTKPYFAAWIANPEFLITGE